MYLHSSYLNKLNLFFLNPTAFDWFILLNFIYLYIHYFYSCYTHRIFLYLKLDLFLNSKLNKLPEGKEQTENGVEDAEA